MLGFSIAFALPFTFFAFFPSLLQRLPKSGGWLNSVKIVLGFIELAFGFKFLSVADQTYHWGILDREIYLAIWIVISGLLGLYLIGKLTFSHDSEQKRVSVPRLALAIVAFTFMVYLIPGMFGAPLKALSGYLPPQSTHDFDLNAIIRDNANIGKAETVEVCSETKYNSLFHLPHGLKGYFDFVQGVECAKQQNKPIFIDFTGHGCVNCREMEANVWSDPQVLKLLREKFVIVTLYVDDKTDLPENEWVTSLYDGNVKKTIGKKYADFQISWFNVNAQPYYVLFDPFVELKEKSSVEKAKLVQPKAYDLNAGNFVTFLNNGLSEFNKRHGVPATK
jgi:thiol:disulfide interchange protein DsbD